jgi:hypothetical protein
MDVFIHQKDIHIDNTCNNFEVVVEGARRRRRQRNLVVVVVVVVVMMRRTIVLFLNRKGIVVGGCRWRLRRVTLQ